MNTYIFNEGREEGERKRKEEEGGKGEKEGGEHKIK